MNFSCKYKFETAQKYIFAALMLFAVLYSMWLKNDNVYDFQNYHYYNAFAFLNNRLNYDIVPATVNGFFNPLLDLPLYFLVHIFNDYPLIIFAFQGLWFGLLLIMVFKICSLIFDFSRPENLTYFLFIVLFITTGRAIMPQIGSSTNEIAINALDLWGLYLLFKMLKFPQQQERDTFIGAGFIIGCALGLKQTSICCALVSGIMLIFSANRLQKPLKYISAYAFGGFLGVMLTHGWFMWQYWYYYGNPFFPFLNGIFHSPFMDNFSYIDNRWILPFWQTLLAPYIWYFDKAYEPEGFSGYQFPVYCTIAYGLLFYLVITRKVTEFKNKNPLLFAMLVFTILGFLFWQQLFAIMRYMGVIEIIYIIFSIALIHKFTPKSVHNCIFFLLAVPLILFNRLNYWDLHNRDPLTKFVEVEQLNLPPDTLIKLYGRKLSFLVPILAKDNPTIRALGYYHDCKLPQNQCISGKGSDFAERGKFRDMRDMIESRHTGPVIIFYDDMHFMPEVIRQKQVDPTLNNKLRECFKETRKNKTNIACDNLFYIFETDKMLLRDLEGKLCRPLNYNLTYDSLIYVCMPPSLISLQKKKEN